mmetsp:Transcript_24296/g.37511  ORF Transcript_24296/g.37511 Transcript_24296/m.37511 type:complete len:198 (-) Transcript_24296:428-1021(-)
MLKNLQSTEHKQLLNYNRGRIIDIDSDKTSESDSEESKEGDRLDEEALAEKKRLKNQIHTELGSQIKHAFDFSIIQGAYLNLAEKKSLMSNFQMTEETATKQEERISVAKPISIENLISEDLHPLEGEIDSKAELRGTSEYRTKKTPPVVSIGNLIDQSEDSKRSHHSHRTHRSQHRSKHRRKSSASKFREEAKVAS